MKLIKIKRLQYNFKQIFQCLSRVRSHCILQTVRKQGKDMININ